MANENEPDEIHGSYLNGVAAERERCAKIAENATMGLSPGPLYSAGFAGAKKFIADRIRYIG